MLRAWVTTVARATLCCADHERNLSHQRLAKTRTGMCLGDAKQSDLRFLAACVAREVANRLAVHLGHEDGLSGIPEAFLDPRLVQQVTFGALELLVKVKSRVTVKSASRATQSCQVGLARQPHSRILDAQADLVLGESDRARVKRTSTSTKCFALPVRVSRVIGIGQEIQAVDPVAQRTTPTLRKRRTRSIVSSSNGRPAFRRTRSPNPGRCKCSSRLPTACAVGAGIR